MAPMLNSELEGENPVKEAITSQALPCPCSAQTACLLFFLKSVIILELQTTLMDELAKKLQYKRASK